MLFRYLGAAAFVTAIVAMPGRASAQTPDGIRYDCDTAANHFSELVLPAIPAPFIVTGKVRLMTLAASTKYVPMTQLAISTASDKPGPADEDLAGFKYIVAPTARDKPPSLPFLAFVTQKASGKDNGMQILAKPSDAEVAFTLLYDGADVTVIIDGHEKKFELKATRPVVRITCSTGEFLYSDLRIRPND
jgi:hypothetical protein